MARLRFLFTQYEDIPELVYICSPYAGDISGNIEKAKSYAKLAIEHGLIPICSHCLFAGIIDEASTNREQIMSMCLRLIDVCDIIWVCGDVISDGMQQELDYCREQGKRVVYMRG